MRWEDFENAIKVRDEAQNCYDSWIDANRAISCINENKKADEFCIASRLMFVYEDGCDSPEDDDEDEPVVMTLGKNSSVALLEVAAVEAHERYTAKLETLKKLGIKVPEHPFKMREP